MRKSSFFAALTNVFVLLAVLPQRVGAWRDRTHDAVGSASDFDLSEIEIRQNCNFFAAKDGNCFATSDCQEITTAYRNGKTHELVVESRYACQVPAASIATADAVGFALEQLRIRMEQTLVLERGYHSLRVAPELERQEVLYSHLQQLVEQIGVLFGPDAKARDSFTDEMERVLKKAGYYNFPEGTHPLRWKTDLEFPVRIVPMSGVFARNGAEIHEEFRAEQIAVASMSSSRPSSCAA